MLLGLGWMLSLKSTSKLDGKPGLALTDQLMAHLLWGMDLSAERLIAEPRVNLHTEIMLDGSISFHDELVNTDQATASELREMTNYLRSIKRNRRSTFLLGFSGAGTWEERWKHWNQLFPVLAFPSPGAMRKAYSYAKKHRSQMPDPSAVILGRLLAELR